MINLNPNYFVDYLCCNVEEGGEQAILSGGLAEFKAHYSKTSRQESVPRYSCKDRLIYR